MPIEYKDPNTGASIFVPTDYEKETINKRRKLDADISTLREVQVSVEYFPKLQVESSDRPRFQRAFDYAKDNGVGTIIIPKKDYIFDGTPVVIYDNTVIESNGAKILIAPGTYNKGIGFFTTRVDSTGTPKVSVDYDATVSLKRNITFRGKLILDGNIGNVICTNSTSTCNGIIAYRLNNLSVDGLTIQNLPGTVGGGYGIIVAYSETVYLKEITIDRTDRQSICIWETLDAHIDKVTLNNSYFRECILVSTNTPASLQSSYCTISNSKLKNLSTTATHVVRFSGLGSGVIENCEIEGSNVLDGIYITDIYYKFVRVLNNKIKGCLYGIRVESDTDKYVIIENNEIENCINGIRHNASGGVAIYTKNKVKGTTTQPFYIAYVDYQTITDNDFDGGTQLFIRPAIKSHVLGNNIRNMSDSSYAVLIGGDSTVSISYMMNTVKNNTSNNTRILSSGRAIGNDSTITTTTCKTDQIQTSISSPPTFVGQEALVSGVWYKSIGTSSSSDWKQIS